MKRIARYRPSPALLVSVVALVVACAGTALAGNLITGKDIKNGSIKPKDLSKAAKAALTGPQGPRGEQGAPGKDGEDGQDGQSAFGGGTIPSGTTITGAWGGRYIAAIAGTQENSYLLTYSFPLPAPVKLTDADVQFGANTAGPVGDADPACDGTLANPTAPAGKVCIYSNDGANGTRSNSTLTGFKLTAAGVATDADAYGFTVRMVDAGTVPGRVRAEGTWAYTAP
ncbi:MAG: hypothetical protein M9964_11830 [Solirubrobacterales bacterium]|nr:hypothetical protein [Thermoleophilales bacterium]MCO5327722.1 hypothetical protein [Solirubrobacterales bacterium]